MSSFATFNAAGAHESGEIGEDHNPETHLIPIVLQHLLGQRDKISVFGTDYDTPDGTCIRDYIHVTDLAKAHILALEALLNGKKKTAIYNLGNGSGYSVKEVIETCEKVTGRKAVIEYTDRRPGDPARLVASSQKIYKELGWKAEYSLEEIIASAWKWHSRNANLPLNDFSGRMHLFFLFGGDFCYGEKAATTRNRAFQTYIDQSVSTRGIVRQYHRKRYVPLLSDVVIDACGAGIALFVARIYLRKIGSSV
ncbi:hypothetical protein GGR02_003453 [Anoxybacillus voinovskiensis]|uniref:UDP-glucose 4-epimerase n=1 Tax=Anoxybacteroides voinovskiense TaxID=230470 RepID=A0A840DR48_9BACL|nr:hypothetical protein [Anoxybacillus voinovskiensis]GGJ80346.1 hypothetical protein GCM10008982_32350 [Anoxybacillus voinovskiensis]